MRPTQPVRTLIVLACFGASLLASYVLAQQAPPPGLAQPRLLTVMPMGGKQGTTVEVALTGTDVDEPEGLLFSNPAIKAELVNTPEPPPDPKNPAKAPKGKAAGPTQTVKYKVTIPPAVAVGTHDVRIVNKHGVSNPRAFVVGDQTDVNEVEPNNDVPQAQKVELNTTVNGVIGSPTDVDYFTFTGKKGQRVVVSCLASSIDSRLYPVIELYDPSGKRLAVNRDYQGQDALVDSVLPADGAYHVRVVQFTHTVGTPEHFYRLTISTAPWIDAVFPSVVEPGKATPVTVYGRNLPGGQLDPTATLGGSVLEKATATVNVPNDPMARQRLDFSGYVPPPGSGLDGFEYRVRNDAGSSNAFMLNLANSPVVLENPANVKREAAQAVPVPCEVAGRLNTKHTQGYFTFDAKKGDVLSIEVLSDRLGSPSDLTMSLYGADGKLLVEQDDDPEILSGNQFFTRTSDPARYRFAPTVDGKYTVLVKSHDSTQLDARNRYHLRISPEQPDFRLVAMPTSHYQPEGTVLRQGSSQDWIVFVFRQDGFNGEINLSADNLPAGVECKPQNINPTAKNGVLVLSANPDAPNWTGEVKIKGTAKINGKDVVREARSASITWPNPPQQANVPTFSRLDRGIVMAVREKGPFGLGAEADKPIVLQGDKVNIKLKLDRYWADFKAPVAVTLVVPGQIKDGGNQPKDAGITVAPVTIAPDKADGTAVVDVKATTPPGTYTVVLRGTAPTNPPMGKDSKDKKGATVNTPANPVIINVLPKELAKLTLTPPNGAGKIGGNAEIVVKVARLYDFPGEFKLALVLPPNAKGVSADEVTIPAGKDEAKFVIKLADDAAPGALQGLLIKATAVFKDTPVAHEAKFNLNVTK